MPGTEQSDTRIRKYYLTKLGIRFKSYNKNLFSYLENSARRAKSGQAGMAGVLAARLGALVASLIVLAAPSGAAETLAGPVPARVLRVVDGDTMAVRAHVWLGQDVEVTVRLSGVDAPELRGPCAVERTLAQRAREYLIGIVRVGAIELHDIRYGKYAGRVLARGTTPAGHDLGTALTTAASPGPMTAAPALAGVTGRLQGNKSFGRKTSRFLSRIAMA